MQGIRDGIDVEMGCSSVPKLKVRLENLQHSICGIFFSLIIIVTLIDS